MKKITKTRHKMKRVPLAEAYAKATQGTMRFLTYGKQYCFHEGNRAAIVTHTSENTGKPTEPEADDAIETTVAEVWSTEGDQDRYDAALFVHARNALPEVLVLVAMALSQLDRSGAIDDAESAGAKSRLRAAIAKASTVEVPE